MKSFAQRIQYCVDKGRLTGADLSVWFGRPYPTVRTWREGLSEPWKPWRGEAEQWLEILEKLVRDRLVFPMASSFNAAERRRYMRELRDAWNTRLPKTRST